MGGVQTCAIHYIQRTTSYDYFFLTCISMGLQIVPLTTLHEWLCL